MPYQPCPTCMLPATAMHAYAIITRKHGRGRLTFGVCFGACVGACDGTCEGTCGKTLRPMVGLASAAALCSIAVWFASLAADGPNILCLCPCRHAEGVVVKQGTVGTGLRCTDAYRGAKGGRSRGAYRRAKGGLGRRGRVPGANLVQSPNDSWMLSRPVSKVNARKVQTRRNCPVPFPSIQASATMCKSRPGPCPAVPRRCLAKTASCVRSLS